LGGVEHVPQQEEIRRREKETCFPEKEEVIL
jgi:hypothetical protein